LPDLASWWAWSPRSPRHRLLFKAQNLLTNYGFRPASAEDLPGVFCSETNQSGRLPSRFLRQMPEEKTLYYYGYRLNHTG
jgi:hypothetical protein